MTRALVLSGGGSRGAYEIGACKALKELGIEIDMVFGTSVGAINGALIAQGDLELAERLWLELSTDKVFDIGDTSAAHLADSEPYAKADQPSHDHLSAMTKIADALPGKITDALPNKLTDAIPDKLSSALPDRINELSARISDKIKEQFAGKDIAGMPAEEAAAYLREIITNGGAANTGLMDMMREYIDEEKVRESSIHYGLVATELPSMTGHFINKENIPEGQLHDYIMASASCFPAVQVCEIDGKKYIDGGYVDNLPVQMALDRGAEEIIAINLKAVGLVRQDTISHAKATCKSYVSLKPQADLGNMLSFNKENTARLITLGYLDTMRKYGQYDGKRYTFEKGQFSPEEVQTADALAVKYSMNPAMVYNRENFLGELLKAYPRAYLSKPKA